MGRKRKLQQYSLLKKKTLIPNALLHANRPSVWGFLRKLNQASLPGNEFPNPQCYPSVALCVQGPWVIQSSWNQGRRGRKLQLEKQRAQRESSHGVFCTCPGYFLKKLQIFNFLHFFKPGESWHYHRVLLPTDISCSLVPSDVLCNKMFLQVCKMYHNCIAFRITQAQVR